MLNLFQHLDAHPSNLNLRHYRRLKEIFLGLRLAMEF